MSNEQVPTEEPFWRRPLPPIPGATATAKVTDSIEHHAEPVIEPEVLPPADPYEAAKAAEHALDLARAEARECRDATMKARVVFGKALEAWNSAGTVMTQEQQARQFIAQSNADRAARAVAGQGIVHPGITRTARAMAGGNQRRGGGSAYRRGPGGTTAFTKAEAMTLDAKRLQVAAAARVKLPSEK